MFTIKGSRVKHLESDNVIKDFKFCNPEEIFTLFDLGVQIRATTQIDGDDHCYAHSNPRLRSAFTVTLP